MPVIENLMVANHAEAIGGLLYVSGGGWTEHWRGPASEDGQYPPSHLGIAITMLTGWLETNRRFPMRIVVEPEDGGEALLTVEGETEAGRPPGLPEGTDLRGSVAVNTEIVYPHPGGYRIVAQIGEDTRSVSFRVHDLLLPGAIVPAPPM
jgi:hypothetical protein